MKQPNIDEETVIEDLPRSPVLGPVRKKRYGKVQGLDEDDLADPDELERQVYEQELGPVLLLPVKYQSRGIQPAVDEQGRVDWGAFASIDFERMQPQFDKARYKADKLREELKDLIIRISMLDEKIKSRAKYRVLKYVRMGWLDVDDIADWDTWFMARYWMRSLKLRRQIAELETASYERRKRQAQQFWARFD